MNIKFSHYIFFNRKNVGSKRKLAKIYKVKLNSYAGRVVERIYNYYFGDSIKIKKEYKRYYRKEYNSCEDFLICRFNMSRELAKKILKENTHYVDLEFKGDEISYSFSYDDELTEFFWNNLGGLIDEN